MNIVSWNINGLRSCLRKGLADFVKTDKSDVYCFQEAKISTQDLNALVGGMFSVFPNYKIYSTQAVKKGYSGLIFLTKKNPINFVTGVGDYIFDNEARLNYLEFKDFYLVNTYFPHPARDLKRLSYKIEFGNKVLSLVGKLKDKKAVIVVGDFNVVHTIKDAHNKYLSPNTPLYTQKERDWFSKFLKSGFIDSFRYIHPNTKKYSWFRYSIDNVVRKSNKGWRLDYCCVSNDLKNKVLDCDILSDVWGSDHVPVKLTLSK